MSIIKEFYENTISMSRPGNPHAAPMVTGTTCVLRYDDGKPLNHERFEKLLVTLLMDFRGAALGVVTRGTDRIEVDAPPPNASYKKIDHPPFAAVG